MDEFISYLWLLVLLLGLFDFWAAVIKILSNLG